MDSIKALNPVEITTDNSWHSLGELRNGLGDRFGLQFTNPTSARIIYDLAIGASGEQEIFLRNLVVDPERHCWTFDERLTHIRRLAIRARCREVGGLVHVRFTAILSIML